MFRQWKPYAVRVARVRALVALAITLSCTSAFAQWLKYPTAGLPRTGNGKLRRRDLRGLLP